MRKQIPVLFGMIVIGFLVGCQKKIPVAAKTVPAPPTPAIASAPRPATTSPARSFAPTTAPQPVAKRPASMTPQERETLNQRLAHLSDALFDYDTANIRSDATSALRGDVDVVRGILSNYPSQKLVVEGDADERGSAEYNLALGDRRARAAEKFLVMMGIPEVQLTIVSYGKERPVCEEHDEACWQKNRRAHITAAP